MQSSTLRIRACPFNEKNDYPILEVHPEFAQPIDITHAAVANLADTTASKVEDLLTQIRTSLIRVISDWEKSRQGEGGVQDLD